MAFIKEFNGRRIGDGVYFDGPEAESLIEQGVAIDAKDYQKMLEDKKEHAKELREVREEKKETKDKAPEAPKKDKMVRSPKQKKTVKPEPAEPAMRWRK